MLRSSKTLYKLGATVIGVTVCFGGLIWVKWILSLDPFKHFEKASDPSVGIQLQAVSLKHYKLGVLVSQATAASMTVDRNRSRIGLEDVTNGFTNSGSQPFHFEAKKAFWDDFTRHLSVSQGAHVWNANLNLRTAAFAVDRGRDALIVDTPIQGLLAGGTVKAERLQYNFKSGDWQLTKPEWEGELALASQATEAQGKSKWRIRSDGVASRTGDTETWPNAIAKTSEGDVIIKAQQVLRDVKTDTITATGKVVYFSKKVNMTCEKAIVYRKEKRAIFSGSVRCYFKPEAEQEAPVAEIEIPPFQPDVPDAIASARPTPAPGSETEELRDPGNAKKYPVLAFAEKIEYWYGKGSRRGIITGKPQAIQQLPAGKWRKVWTQKGLYDGEKETLRLVSDSGKQTRVKTSVGDDLKCTWFEISTKENTDSWSASGLEGDVMGDDEETSTPVKPDTKAPGKPQPKPLEGHLKV